MLGVEARSFLSHHNVHACGSAGSAGLIATWHQACHVLALHTAISPPGKAESVDEPPLRNDDEFSPCVMSTCLEPLEPPYSIVRVTVTWVEGVSGRVPLAASNKHWSSQS